MSCYIYLTVASRDKIRSKTVKRDDKILHSNVEYFYLQAQAAVGILSVTFQSVSVQNHFPVGIFI
jgi:hypothetical protein